METPKTVLPFFYALFLTAYNQSEATNTDEPVQEGKSPTTSSPVSIENTRQTEGSN